MRVPTLERRFLIITLVAAGLTVSGTVHADTIRISTVEALWSGPSSGELFRVDLGVNPGAVLTGQQSIFSDGSLRAVVTFDAILAGHQTGNLRATFQWPEGWPLPLSNLTQDANFPGADIVTFGLDFPIVYHPVPVTLTLSVPGGVIEGPSSFTFSVVQPAPEPASVALCGAALVAAMLARRRMRARGSPDDAR